MEEVNYIYVIERWDDIHKEWMPYRFDVSDLEEMGKTINLLEDVLPNIKFRSAQYTVSEFQYIRSFG